MGEEKLYLVRVHRRSRKLSDSVVFEFLVFFPEHRCAGKVRIRKVGSRSVFSALPGHGPQLVYRKDIRRI